MAATIEKIPPVVEDIIRSSIAEVLAGIPIASISIEAELDHTDDEAISVHIHHPPMDQVFDSQLETDLMMTVHRRLLESGERRFAYITHHHVDP